MFVYLIICTVSIFYQCLFITLIDFAYHQFPLTLILPNASLIDHLLLCYTLISLKYQQFTKIRLRYKLHFIFIVKCFIKMFNL